MRPVKNDILIYDSTGDSSGIRESLKEKGYGVVMVERFDVVLQVLSENPNVAVAIISAARISESLLTLLDDIKEDLPAVRTVVISGEISVNRAVDVMKTGAHDYIMRPVDSASLIFNIEKLMEDPVDTNDEISNDKPDNTPVSAKNTFLKKGHIVTQNARMIELLELLDQVADSTASVLIQGESGTGKELIAKYIHEKSQRKNRPFIALNCAALPENLLESELFGHEKGAFTGAVSRKPGKFELADGGTILLDEITEMQLHLQSKLLRVIQEREVDRLGGAAPVNVDVRILATTNRDIEASVERNEFRSDLYYRLNVIPVKIPSLRQRKDDIEILVKHFIDKFNALDGRDVKSLTSDSLDALKSYDFPGNVRELENLVQRGVLLASGRQINTGNLFPGKKPATLVSNSSPEISSELSSGNLPGASPGAAEGIPESISDVPLREVEKKIIFHTLDKTSGNRTHAAKILGISVRTLRNKLNEYKE
jgi:two-component system response regulator FlrC